MTRAIEASLPKLRIEEAAARTQARIDSGAQAVIGVNKYRPRDEAPIEILKVDNAAVRQLQIDKLGRLKRERDPQAVADGARRAHAHRRRRQRQSAGACHRCRARQGDGRRNIAGAGEGLWPPSGRDQVDLRRLPAGGRHVGRRRTGAEARRRIRGERRPPAAHPGRQDRPGRPRPRPEGDRVGVRRSRLRRRHRAAVCDAGRSRAPGGRERRAHPRHLVARRRASDAGAGAQGRARAATAAPTS